MTGPIVVGVEGPDAVAAATLAASFAPRLGRELVLVHAAPDPPVFPYGDRRLKELQRREAIALLGGVSGSLAATSPCPVLVVPNELDDEAVRDAAHGPLLLGADGTQSANRAGSVAACIADRLDTSVLPVRIKGLIGTASVPVVVVPRSSISHDELAHAA
jgi:hypothetical protein